MADQQQVWNMSMSQAHVTSAFPAPFFNVRSAFQSTNAESFSSEASTNKAKLELENSEMWSKFHQYGTEMIITKPGRRMFPTLRYQASALDLNTTYAVYLQLVAIDDCRYKYSNGKWSVNGRMDGFRDDANSSRLYMHPDSPATGRLWMKQPISFHKVKLTNNNASVSNGLVVLNSMHKYRAVVYVVRMHNVVPNMSQIVACASFEETDFIAVTAYQNEKITQLKIDFNPFAKGFREHGRHEEKRKCPSVELEKDFDNPAKHQYVHAEPSKDIVALGDTRVKTMVARFDTVTPPSYNVAKQPNEFQHLQPRIIESQQPIPTVWNPMGQIALPLHGFHHQPLNDWLLPRQLPLLPMNHTVTPTAPWWMGQRQFGYLF